MRAFVFFVGAVVGLQLILGLTLVRPGERRRNVTILQVIWFHVWRTAVVCWAFALLYLADLGQAGSAARPTAERCTRGAPILLTRVVEPVEPRVKGTRMGQPQAEVLNGPALRHGAGRSAGEITC